MKCEKCGAESVVYDAKDTHKPLRCSDACAENRKSLVERGVGTKQPQPAAKKKYLEGYDT